MHDPCLTTEHRPLLAFPDAVARLVEGTSPIQGIEYLGLGQATGRVLAREVRSTIDYPPFTNSAVDGFALSAPATAGSEFTIVGTAWAGSPFLSPVGPAECVRILTGASLPEGTDAVIMQEEASIHDRRVSLNRAIAADECVRRAGRDFTAGQTVLSAGHRLSALDIGLLAAIGETEIEVLCRPRVGILATGSELRPPGQGLEAGQVYDSNRFAVAAVLRGWGVEVSDLGTCADDPEALSNTIGLAAGELDALITIGGASVGDADHIMRTFDRLGEVTFWKVAIKPGKPFAFGRVGNCRLFGLPGNPVSALVTLLQLVRPAMFRLMGTTAEPPLRITAELTRPITKSNRRLEFQRGFVQPRTGRIPVVDALPGQDADRILSFSAANCFIVLPPDSPGADRGDTVMIEPFACFF
ncbi:MAG: gephyrin-like molybdotransferase Glp [Methylotetracoccus sp.]